MLILIFHQEPRQKTAKLEFSGFHCAKDNSDCGTFQMVTIDRDSVSKKLVFTGPNGNSISSYCRQPFVYFWLDDYVEEDHHYGQSFNIGPDKHLWINDKEILSELNVRLCLKGKKEQ